MGPVKTVAEGDRNLYLVSQHYVRRLSDFVI